MVGERFDLPEDPRLAPKYVRVVDSGAAAPVVLVGVVHDHPASVYRARTVVDAVAPGAVALELPDALVDLFATYAERGDGVGGEMAAAVDAAGDATVVGIDAPNPGSLRALAAEARAADASPRDVARTVREFGRLAAETARGWLAAAGVPGEWVDGVPGGAQTFDCSAGDAPADQAAHEAAHVRRSTSLLRSFEVPAAARLLDAARERYMAERLAALGGQSAVVAVVGYSHLDAVADALAGEE
ncbi:hypothetical protein [Halobacterium yunchengense]|uniref:hypothetical protein n=1 Tax=Halobacterium yunchengense TaxID=3108497 RepID=UPI00300B4B9F